MTHHKDSSMETTRREFIKVSGMASIAVLCMPSLKGASASEEQAMFESETLPVLKRCDVLIIGGGFAGVTAARKFAKAGKKVVLVERRIYLGREITSVYRPWFDINPGDGELPTILQSCIEDKIEQPDPSKAQLRFDHVKRSLEDSLFEAGVEILYASNVIQLLADGDRLSGLVIGNKSGRQAILSKLVLDCTETASVVHLSNQSFQKKTTSAAYARTLEFTHVGALSGKSLSVPAELGLENNQTLLQAGYLGEGHYYVTCPMSFQTPDSDPLAITRMEAEAWERSTKVAQYLHQNVPEFADAYFTNSAFQLSGPYTRKMADSNHAKSRKYLGSSVSIGKGRMPISAFATPYHNLYCLNEAALLADELTDYIATPVGAGVIAESVSEPLLSRWSEIAYQGTVETIEESYPNPYASGGSVREKFSPQHGKPYGRITIENTSISVIDSVDVLVVGGGTSGAPATYTAAKAGKKTMVIDMNPGFGGTGTYGGVQSHWGPGGYYGLTAKHNEKVTAITDSFSKRFKDNGNGLWSVQAKLAMWLNEIRGSGADIIWNSFVVGSIMEGRKIEGVVVATPQGVFAVKAKIVIDASGDGDVAVFSGAPFVFGSKHNRVPLWYAIRRQNKPGPTASIFESSVDVTNVEDYTRAVHVGLRTGGDKLHDHQPYLAPRESRHVLGEVVTSLDDHLTYREWEDVVSRHRSNTDMKGYHASDWFRIGLIPPNLAVEIPYRALIPRDVENVIVTGKAISTTHDSFPAIRMQHDLENLGGITALAAVQAIDDHVFVRDIPIRKFQNKLVGLGLLPEELANRTVNQRNYSKAELKEWIRQFDPDISLKSFGNTKMSVMRTDRIPFVEVTTSPAAVAVPVLEEALQANSGKMQLRIALALAMHGSESGALVLFQEIERQLSSVSLPKLKEHVEHSGGKTRTPPDQGASPICANLIYALGMTRSELCTFAIELVSEMFRAESQDDFQNKEKGLFFYIDAVGYAAELTANRALIPSLQKLHANPFLNKQSLKSGIESHHVLERLSLMDLILGRALARCGSGEGYETLIDYLDDMRAVLAGFAHNTLVKVSSQDFGKDKKAWTQWLSSNESRLQPVVLKERPKA
ncbi:MAG: FAD-dependent oxidoreductase [Opitutaceae bacterium]|nr:FAD-dependent oxidoreductase [Opitutaceae bacterium]